MACDAAERYIQSVAGSGQRIDDPDSLNDKALTYLKQYLWKGNRENKNTSGQPITTEEKSIIRGLVKKLVSIRNFHSHAWHDNEVLAFDPELALFVNERHAYAMHSLKAEAGNDSALYEKAFAEHGLFTYINDNAFITPDGRVFLLSFFLHTGSMSLLLQQRMGSKRNDIPEYRFKHQVYKYYCHREGSAWSSTGVEEEKLSAAEAAEQERILRGRQAFRIINYLNDKPAFFNEAIPLYYRDAAGAVQEVADMPGLKACLITNNLLPGITVELQDVRDTLPETAMPGEREENERARIVEQKRRNSTGYLQYKGNTDHEFEITYSALRHIVTDVVLGRTFEQRVTVNDNPVTKEVSAEDHFYGILAAAIEGREHVYYMLKKAPAGESICFDNYPLKKHFNSVYIDYSQYSGITDNVFYTKDQLRYLPVLATPKIEKLLIEWHTAFTGGSNAEARKRACLLNYIRPASHDLDKSPYRDKTGRVGLPIDTCTQPLLFQLSYYYKEQGQKQRQEDHFLEWGLNYLLDFNLLPDCYIEVEQYVYEKKFNEPESPYKLKPVLEYVQQVPPGKRIRIRDGHVTIAVKNSRADGAEWLKFRVGEKLMKYLLCVVLGKTAPDTKTVNGFMLAIAQDYEKVLATGSDTRLDPAAFLLLEPFALPGMLYKTTLTPGGEKDRRVSVRQELAAGLDKKIAWLQEQLQNRAGFNRHRKNKILMEAYQLYDFASVRDGKFLRKNEYEQLSICHYMLNQNADKVMGLIDRTFNLRPRLPERIYSAIKNAAGLEEAPPGSTRLDELLVNILEDRISVLAEYKEQAGDEGIPVKLIRSKLKYLNLPLGDANLNGADREERENKRRESLGWLPFAIHPALALKYFYPEEFAAKKFDGNTPHHTGDKVYTNLFANLRKNTILTEVLVREYYDMAKVNALYEAAMAMQNDEEKKTQLQKQLKVWTGKVLDTHTRDLLLSLAAQQYLKAYDDIMAGQFAKLSGQKKINIAELFTNECSMALEKKDYNPGGDRYSPEDIMAMPDRLYISFRLHQVDDYFFRTKRRQLYELALHYRIFREEELAFYRDNPEIYETILKWPDGSRERPVPLGQLIQENKNVISMAVRLTAYLMAYEQKVLERYIEAENKKTPGLGKQDCIQRCTDRFEEKVEEKHKKHSHLGFETVLLLDGITGEGVKGSLRRLRNACMHNAIPLAGSFSALAAPGTAVAETLGITKRLAPDREQYKAYVRDEKNEAGKEGV